MERTLHQVFLMASDVDASQSFYEEGLGFTVTERGERSVRFETGRCELMLEEDFEPETLAAFGLTPPGESRGDGVIVVVEVADVAAVYEQAEEYGAEVLMEPREVEWGREMMLVRDPDGYVIEVSRPLDE